MPEDHHLPPVSDADSDPNTPRTVLVGFVGTVLLVVIIVALQTLFYNVEKKEYQRKIVNQIPEELASLKAQQTENLHAYRWIDKASGIVAIPIDRAIELVVQESSNPAAPVIRPTTPKQP